MPTRTLLAILFPLATLLSACPVDKADTGGERCYQDLDEDGYGDERNLVIGCGALAAPNSDDCDDLDAERHPGADEICSDGTDSDCDLVDEVEGEDCVSGDLDGDGHLGVAHGGEDCDDDDALVYPGAEEHCDDRDEDCDGEADEDPVDATTLYTDADADGYGDPALPVSACAVREGLVTDALDCDDADALAYPGAEERCDDRDDDCDGEVDEDPVDPGIWYRDVDADGYGDPSRSYVSCDAPDGYVADGTDCDPRLPRVNPGAFERCNDVDDDCDAEIDEDAVDPSTWYTDGDKDGFGDSTLTTVSCAAPEGSSSLDGDCDDDDATVHPGAIDESGDGLDLDCDGEDRCTPYFTYEGSLEFTEDSEPEDLDVFCDAYGGLSVSVSEDVWVWESALEDFAGAEGGLRCVCEVEGALTVGAYVYDFSIFSTGDHDPEDLTEMSYDMGENYALNSLDGLDALTRVGGDVTIGGNRALTNTNALSSLEEIGGSLYFLENETLTDLRGLINLSTLGGDLVLTKNENLRTLHGLQNISAVDDLYVRDNDGLTDLSALSLDRLMGDLWIVEMDALTTLPSFSETSTGTLPGALVLSANAGTLAVGLTGLVGVEGDLTVEDNSALSSLAVLGELESVTGSIQISGNPSLTGLEDLALLSTVGGDLVLSDNDGLVSLEGLEGILALEGGLSLSSNDALETLDGLDALETVAGSLTLSSNSGLLSLEGLDGLSAVGGTLRISGEGPATLSGLPQLEWVGGDLAFADLSTTDVITGFNLLQVVDGSWTLTDSPSVRQVLGFASLTALGGLEIESVLDAEDEDYDFESYYDDEETVSYEVIPSELYDLSGLARVTTIDGDLVLLGLSSLEDLDGLSSLQQVGGGLSVEAMSSLTNLDGLGALQSVGGDLRLVDDELLLDVNGLGALSEIGNELYLEALGSLTTLDGLEALRTVGGAISLVDLVTLEDIGALATVTSVGDPGAGTAVIFIFTHPALSCEDIEAVTEAIDTNMKALYGVGLSAVVVTSPSC